MVGVLHYHVSPVRNRASIEAHGLDDGKAFFSPWSNIDDWDPGVYLWDALEAAERYADELMSCAHTVEEGVSDIYAVDVLGTRLLRDPSIGPERLESVDKGPWLRHAFYSPQPIGASRVRLVGTRPAIPGSGPQLRVTEVEASR